MSGGPGPWSRLAQARDEEPANDNEAATGDDTEAEDATENSSSAAATGV